MTLRSKIRASIEGEVGSDVQFSVEFQENAERGDYSSNIAMILAKKEGKSAQEFAAHLSENIKTANSELFEKIEVAGPGFLNFFINKDELYKQISEFEPELFQRRSKKERIIVEYISANPTGPLTIGNGRGGFMGDVLSNVLSFAGYEVLREYYVNDTGRQVNILGASMIKELGGKVENYPEDELYKGSYIKEVADEYYRMVGGAISDKDVSRVGMWGSKKILADNIKVLDRKLNIKFDHYFSEKDGLKNSEYEKIFNDLKDKGHTKFEDGANWYVSDNQKRVLTKSGGVIENERNLNLDGENKKYSVTYLFSDLVYHKNKFVSREYDKAIDIWGADHHGYKAALLDSLRSLDIKKKSLEIIITQLVRLTEKGQEVKVSKRKGTFVALEELVDEVGLDAVRWFFLERSPNTHMDFDMTLAKERSKKNPVYYVQYSHARAYGILSKKRGALNSRRVEWKILKEKEEIDLVRNILLFSEIIEDVSASYEVSLLTRYAYSLAKSFTSFYENINVVGSGDELESSRLAITAVTKQTLMQALHLMGISSPNKM